MSEINRRSFLKMIIGAIAAVIAVILGGPLIASIMGPFFQKKDSPFVKVPGFISLPENKMTSLSFQILEQDSFFRLNETQQVWVIKHSADQATVFSPICTHLACRVNWQGDWEKFACPCHGSVFNADGQVVSGPAPRPLDTLPSKIVGGELYVQWKIYKAGIAKKVEI